MESLTKFTAVKVDEADLSLADVLRSAKWLGELGFLEAAVDLALILRQADQLEIEVSDDELQQAADQFRIAHGLYEAGAVEDWLATNHLTLDDWERSLENEVLTRKLRDALTERHVEQFFAENRSSFDAAVISRLIVSDEEIAKELRAQIREENADFHKLARTYSLDATTRPAGGYMGKVARAELGAECDAAVFGAEPGRIVGPIKTNQGWSLIRVHSLHPATLDEAARERIKSSLFEEWLARQRGKAKIRMPLLEEGEDKEQSADR